MQFDQFADDYAHILDNSVGISGEDSKYFAEYKAGYLHRIYPPSFSGKVLDFGCGVGLLAGYMKRAFPAIQLDGFDVSADSIRRVDPDLAAQGCFTSRSADLAADYQLIVVANVMHHVPPDQRTNTVQELARRLVHGGRLVIFEHNPANPVTRRIVERCPFDEDAILLPPGETSGYVRQAGLQIGRRDYIVFMPRPLAWLRRFEPSLSWLPLGAQYVVVAHKHA